MSNPFRDLGVNLHIANKDTDPEDILEFSLGQSEARLQQEMVGDKIRAVKSIASRIDNTKEFIKKAKGKAKKMLKQQLAELEQEQFELLRDEILSVCKDSAGLLDMKKLRKVKGSREFVAKIEGKNKPKLNEGRNK